jgi:threonylcarbamoyladenosine tRNA methylthiotransferase CDKAL1
MSSPSSNPLVKNPIVEVRSFGCSANFGEGEMMQGLLKSQNMDVLSVSGEAIAGENSAQTLQTEKNANPLSANQANPQSDVIVMNVCTVKGDSSALKDIRLARAQNPQAKMVVGGCVTPELAKKVQKLDAQISVTTTHGIEAIAETVQKTLAGETVFDLEKRAASRVKLPRVRANRGVGILTVCAGCLDRCAFCSTVIVKGKLQSYPIESIVEEATALVNDGCKELWITGQDAACYGFDIGTNLAHLVRELCKIQGDFFIRMGMGNPRHLVTYIDELVEVMKHPKVFQFLHLPVQAGSDRVLESMKRRHRVAEYNILVKKLKSALPAFTLSTDIIVGYPGESREDFNQTLELLKWSKPSVVNRTRFVPREGTVAAQLTEIVPEKEKKERSRELTQIFKDIAYQNNLPWMGWVGVIVVDEFGNAENTRIGRNFAYKSVVVQGAYEFGTFLKVKVTQTDTFSLKADVIEVVQSLENIEVSGEF